MSVMTLSDVWPWMDRPLTVDDLLRLPDDGNRYELADGVLEVSPPPLSNHNSVATRLGFLLHQHRPPGLEVVLNAGVNLARDRHRIPDIVVVRSEWIHESDFFEQPPLLAVEIASNSTRNRDRTTKKQEYEEFGVGSYWIVEPGPDNPSIIAYDLTGTGYRQVALVRGTETFHVTRPFPVTVVPDDLVA